MRAAFYIRMSREEQDESPDVQRANCLKFVAERGWTPPTVDLDFYDEAKSRAEFVKRPGLLRMIAAAERHEFDVLVTRDDDRIGGDMYRSGMVLMNLIEAGIRVFYYQTNAEARLDTPEDKVILAVKGFASELERGKISARTRENHEKKANDLKVTGGKTFGYNNREVLNSDGARDYVLRDIFPEQAEIVVEMYTRYAEGQGIRTIAHELNRRGIPAPRAGKRGTGSWSSSCIAAMLSRPLYRGLLVWGQTRKGYRHGTRVRDDQPPEPWVRKEVPALRIISEELWARVEARRQKNAKLGGPSKTRRGAKPRALLSGLARCAECGGPIHVYNRKQGRVSLPAYGCTYHRERGATVCGNALRRPVGAVDAAFLEWLEHNMVSEEILAGALREIRQRLKDRAKDRAPELARLTAQIRKLRAEIDRLANSLLSTADPPATLVRMISERESKLTDLQAQLATAKVAPDVIDLEARRLERLAREQVANFRELLAMDRAEIRKYLEAIWDGPLNMIPDHESKRYALKGQTILGSLLAFDRCSSGSVPSGI
jgi:site-specific DNA recombinase